MATKWTQPGFDSQRPDMKTIVHRADTRGKGDHGWLSTRHSFSFANWHEPSRMGFGALRVLNDDTIAPASGFPPHGHRDMEIITIVTSGTLTHQDSLGNIGAIPAGDVQVMSAGTGIVHSEYNASETEPLTLFQIWIESKKKGIAPRYAQKSFEKSGDVTLLVGPTQEHGALAISQDAYLSRARVKEGEILSYAMKHASHGAYIFVITGKIKIGDLILSARDAAGISEAGEMQVQALEQTDLLAIEVPLA